MASTIVGSHVIVVGGGLAGLSAAHTILERGGRCLVLDKKDFLGGNSIKATSGINGALTNTQIKLGIPDSAVLFEKDTALSANKGVNDKSTSLIHTLVYDSAPAVEWLTEAFKLDLSLVSRLGGHSQPRTHRGKEKFPGMTITYALMEKYEDIARADPERAQVIVGARVTKLLTNSDKHVTGVAYEYQGQQYEDYGPVILATGGFAADFSDDSILKRVRPDLMHLPTTNGDHNSGDGIKMTEAIGGATVDLPAVQVHPTGLVHPNEPDAKVKFLAAEALRGVGGLLLDNKGKRFCNELGTRDYVTGEMWKFNAAPYRLVLNSQGTKEIEWHCKHYVGRGLMKHFKSGAELAKEIGIDSKSLAETFKSYNSAAEKGSDQYGKKYFQNLPFNMNDEYHVAVITPVLHYTMGGVKINEKAEIVRDDSSVITGLYAAGEVAGGVHGKNRLGGSGLLGAVVYGRVAGASAAKYLLEHLSTQRAERRTAQLTGQLFSSLLIQQKPQGLVLTLGYQDGEEEQITETATSSQQPQSKSSSQKKSGGPSSKGSSSRDADKTATVKANGVAAPSQKEYDMSEVSKHNTEADCWVVVNGEVLNATPFLDKHPGGRQAILLYAGKDATEEFNMLHKPDVVQKYAPDIILGTIKKEAK